MRADRVCLAGATGYLGTRVAAEFRSRGTPVTAIARCPGDRPALDVLRRMGADLTFVDASRHERYDKALAGVGTAISCMASRNRSVNTNDDFWAIDRDANIRFGLAAVAAAATRIILVATYEGVESRRYTAFSDAKEQAVDAVAAACQRAGIQFTVIRPTAYFSDLTDRAYESVAKHHWFTEIGDGSHRINPVDGSDVAAFIADCCCLSGASRQDHRVGGPEVYTFREIGELAAAILGDRKGVRVRSIPVDLLRAASVLASLAGTFSAAMCRSAALLRWMIYVSTHDAVAPSCGQSQLRDHFEAKIV